MNNELVEVDIWRSFFLLEEMAPEVETESLLDLINVELDELVAEAKVLQ